jgi:imidazolonepropionase-like amidohydrolase
LLIRGARVFDGEKVYEFTDVIVAGNKIAEVGKGLAVPANAEVVQAEGMTLMPGLIDAHAHVWLPENLRQAAVFGVTTVLDMMSDRTALARIRRQLAEGELADCADLRSAGNPFTVDGGHGTEYGFPVETIADPSEARAFVRRRVAEGSDYIKLMLDDGSAWGEVGPSLSRSLLEAGVEAAHAEKRMALVHLGTAEEAMAAVQAGADGLMHIWVGANSPELNTLIRQQNTFVVPTLSVIMAIAEQGQGEELIRDARLSPYLSERAIGRLYAGWGVPTAIDPRQFQPIVMALYQQKTPLLVGTDAGNSGVDHGVSMHGELRLLAQAGLSPTDALRGATSLPAAIFHLEDRGRIQKGRLADLLLVKGDPTKDILATREIVSVWKSGRKINRESYRQQVAAERAVARARPHLPPRVIGDFDAPDTKSSLGLAWTVSTDLYLGGRSAAKLDVVNGGALGTSRALHVSGEAVRSTTHHIWSGVLYSPGEFPMQLVDLSGWRELVFWAKGDGAKFQVHFFIGSTTVPQSQSFVATSDWTEYRFDFRRFGGTLGKDIKGIFFGATSPGAYAFSLDQVQLR